jgi:RNA polymerase sigma factor (sigma-70 family)
VSDAGLDVSVLQRFRNGDDEAVRQVYQRYGKLVFSVAMRVLSNKQQAEDATQQTFLQAWRAASSFDEGREFAPWLATIARRVAIDMQRSENRRPTSSIEVAGVSDPAMITQPPSAEALWESWQVRAAIDNLDPTDRQVVHMQHMQGFTQSEIADRLGVALGTVKSRSFRAHRNLATRLQHLRGEPA